MSKEGGTGAGTAGTAAAAGSGTADTAGTAAAAVVVTSKLPATGCWLVPASVGTAPDKLHQHHNSAQRYQIAESFF